MPSTRATHKDFEIQLSFCSQKANLDEKAMVLKVTRTPGQRRNGEQVSQGLGVFLKARTCQDKCCGRQGESRDGVEEEGLQNSKGHKILEERRGKVGAEHRTAHPRKLCALE